MAKALNNDRNGDASAIAQAIDWAIAQGADVLNLSLGFRFEADEVSEAVRRALDAGKTVVAAVGNDGVYKDRNILCPATVPGVVRVGGYDENGHLAGMSAANDDDDKAHVHALCSVFVPQDMRRDLFVPGSRVWRWTRQEGTSLGSFLS